MSIATLTINPALDKSSRVDRVLPEMKLRCEKPVFEPGGGGINVSRALKKLGGKSEAYMLCGGGTGEYLSRLLELEGIKTHALPAREWTRENLMVMERSTGQQFRFGMPGPKVSGEEWKGVLKTMEEMDPPTYLVASGSLPDGVPVDFYARLARIMRKKNTNLIVDTSGKALIKAAEEGLCLLKPNLKELAELAGKESIDAMEQEEVAQRVLKDEQCNYMVVSLGPRGAMLATKERIEYIVPPTVKVQSAVGAGDSMVAGMVWAMDQGWDLSDVVKYGIAAGTAATMTPGSELCRKEDVEKIYSWLKRKGSYK